MTVLLPALVGVSVQVVAGSRMLQVALPSLTAIDPLGVPEPGDCTPSVTVTVTPAPSVIGPGALTMVVVPAGPTVWPNTADVDGALLASPEYAEVRAYFSHYPARSLMSDHSRAVLYSLVRMMRPQLIAEIGTLHAGTTDIASA